MSSSRWESIVTTAREVDGAFADGTVPELALMMRLARSVLDFQQHLTGTQMMIGARLAPAKPRAYVRTDAAAE